MPGFYLINLLICFFSFFLHIVCGWRKRKQTDSGGFNVVSAIIRQKSNLKIRMGKKRDTWKMCLRSTKTRFDVWTWAAVHKYIHIDIGVCREEEKNQLEERTVQLISNLIFFFAFNWILIGYAYMCDLTLLLMWTDLVFVWFVCVCSAFLWIYRLMNSVWDFASSKIKTNSHTSKLNTFSLNYRQIALYLFDMLIIDTA